MIIVRRRKWSKTAIYVHHFSDFCCFVFCCWFFLSELPMFYMVIYVKIHRQRQQKRLFWLSYLLYKPRGLCFKCGAVCAVRCVFSDQDEDQFACMMVASPKWEKQNLISVIAWTLFGLVCFWRLIYWMTVERMLCFVVARLLLWCCWGVMALQLRRASPMTFWSGQ